jgi:hypothetical protein
MRMIIGAFHRGCWRLPIDRPPLSLSVTNGPDASVRYPPLRAAIRPPAGSHPRRPNEAICARPAQPAGIRLCRIARVDSAHDHAVTCMPIRALRRRRTIVTISNPASSYALRAHGSPTRRGSPHRCRGSREASRSTCSVCPQSRREAGEGHPERAWRGPISVRAASPAGNPARRISRLWHRLGRGGLSSCGPPWPPGGSWPFGGGL